MIPLGLPFISHLPLDHTHADAALVSRLTKMSDGWFAALMIILIFGISMGSALLANCLLLNEICS